MNKTNTTILFTPSNEQLVEIAKEYPDLNKRIKDSIIKDLHERTVKFLHTKIANQSTDYFNKLYQTIESKYFTKGYGRHELSVELQKKFSDLINNKLEAEIEAEIILNLNSQEFKDKLQNRIKHSMLAAMTKELDAKIEIQAKKLIK